MFFFFFYLNKLRNFSFPRANRRQSLTRENSVKNRKSLKYAIKKKTYSTWNPRRVKLIYSLFCHFYSYFTTISERYRIRALFVAKAERYVVTNETRIERNHSGLSTT